MLGLAWLLGHSLGTGSAVPTPVLARQLAGLPSLEKALPSRHPCKSPSRPQATVSFHPAVVSGGKAERPPWPWSPAQLQGSCGLHACGV